MKKKALFAAFVCTSATVATTAAALSFYDESDAFRLVTATAISNLNLPLPTCYECAGADDVQSQYAMVIGKQQTAPMTRMMTADDGLCEFAGGTNGSKATNASGIVVGLDSLDVLSSTAMTGDAGCGPAFSGSTGVFQNGNAQQNWKWILALLYGGKDLSAPQLPADCGSTARRNLVARWQNFFQGGCSNGASLCSNPNIAVGKAVGGALWHAFRPDDFSGEAYVFASILGLTPLPSGRAVNDFGTSPYCNAMNWDTSPDNAPLCTLGNNKQWTGPGGVYDPVANDGRHKRPPPGTWGDNPDPAQGSFGADVLPTSFQDNDPIRRPCIGGATNVHARFGEEVCNLDGALGLVLPISETAFENYVAYCIPGPFPGECSYALLEPYPTNTCNTFAFGKPVGVYTCAPRGTRHSGECPNGDALIAGGCLVPIDSVNGTSNCVSSKVTVAALQNRSLNNPDGRVYNVQIRDGSTLEPAIGYAPFPAGDRTLDFAGGYYRIHNVETMWGNSIPASGCQMADADDQIGCLVQADPCSVGMAANSALSWNTPQPGNMQALSVNGVAPSQSTVSLLGSPGEYPLARKLYMNSLVGFGHVGNTNTDPQATDELTLAQYESNPANIQPILNTYGFFDVTPFCEDFNEQTVCGATTNNNGCLGNPSGIPTANTVCGNGSKEMFEECDHGAQNGVPGNSCSAICRCVGPFPCQ
jgi:hypothetical protein